MSEAVKCFMGCSHQAALLWCIVGVQVSADAGTAAEGFHTGPELIETNGLLHNHMTGVSTDVNNSFEWM